MQTTILFFFRLGVAGENAGFLGLTLESVFFHIYSFDLKLLNTYPYIWHFTRYQGTRKENEVLTLGGDSDKMQK